MSLPCQLEGWLPNVTFKLHSPFLPLNTELIYTCISYLITTRLCVKDMLLCNDVILHSEFPQALARLTLPPLSSHMCLASLFQLQADH